MRQADALPAIREPLILSRAGEGCLEITPEALARMRGYRQLDPQAPEAGGVLLGRHILHSTDIVVDRVTTPQAGDRQARFQFYRARGEHQRIIDQAWHESAGTCTYLGEWHTHPEPVPHPCPTDLRTWRRRLVQDTFSTYLFFVIVGTTHLCVWEGIQGSTELHLLQHSPTGYLPVTMRLAARDDARFGRFRPLQPSSWQADAE